MELINEKQNQITQTRINIENGMKLIIEMDKLFKPKNKYSRGKIYKIIGGNGLIYYGSTCNTLTKRLGQHQSDYKRYKAGKSKKYATSFKVLEQEEHYIKLVEDYSCNSKVELEAREGYYITNNICVNKAIANKYNFLGSVDYQKKYREEHEDDIIKYKKDYYEENAEMLRNKSNDYRANNKEKVAEGKKIHYEANKDLILQKQHKYYETNKESVLARQNKEILCVCGVTHSYGHTWMHQNTQKHKDFVNGTITIEPPKRTDRIKCECGAIYTHSNKSSHIKSAKHQNYINNL